MELVHLDLPLAMYNKLASKLRAQGDLLDATVEEIILAAMEPEEPSCKNVRLSCVKCATVTPHTWLRSTQVAPCTFALMYSCGTKKCYRIRRFGTVMLKDWERLQTPSTSRLRRTAI